VLRIAPVVAAATWLMSFVVRYGVTMHASTLGRITFMAVVLACVFALASGVYDYPGALTRIRDRLQRIKGGVDWEEFDRARARWGRVRGS
jgi:hypothetical protein